MKSLQSIRGMHDLLPEHTIHWQRLEQQVSALFSRYGFSEIRTPIIEQAEVFTRAMGQATDVVEKEMYAFADRNGDVLCLRPEGTAGVVRAVIQHGLLNPPGLKVWYQGPMFRHERPQKGRQRQFHQFGAEVFGLAEPAVEVELIALVSRLWQQLGLTEVIELELNSLGDLEDRQRYRQALVAYLEPHRDALDEDSQRRLDANPLRIFDSKHPQTQTLMSEAPRLEAFLSDAAREHFETVQAMLKELGIGYRLNPGLVRGLDYYSRSVFEWTTQELGSQATVCAGGRYDGLVELQGGKATPGVGFAMGVERLLMLLAQRPSPINDPAAIYVVTQAGVGPALQIAETVREALPGVAVMTDLSGGSLKAQFKRADRSGAAIAIMLGEAEWHNKEVVLKSLRQARDQVTVGLDELTPTLQQWRQDWLKEINGNGG
jgi:histidyl-tRNA synthetase